MGGEGYMPCLLQLLRENAGAIVISGPDFELSLSAAWRRHCLGVGIELVIGNRN